jgi:diguanylate cyclase (GGDEF)-like protein
VASQQTNFNNTVGIEPDSYVMSTHLPLRKPTYAKRLTALGLAVTLGFTAIFGIILRDMGRRDRQKALDGETNLVATIASDISRNIELYDLSLQAVVDGLKLREINDIGPELRRLVLFDRAATAKGLGAILVLNRVGDVIIDSRVTEPEAINHSQRDFFQIHQLRADVGLYISRPWIAKNGEYLISLSRRISSSDGSFGGVVAGNMRLSYFHDLFRKVKLGTDDAINLMRTDGTVLMRAPFEISSIGVDLGKSTVFRQFPHSQAGWYETTSILDGVKRLFVFQQVGEYPLLLINGLSLQTVYAGWRQDAWLLGSLILALCTLNIALVVFLSHQLRRRGEAENGLAVMATTDALTGLCNRRGFDQVIEREWQRSKRAQSPMALLMIDVDWFKAYNDEHGHQAGDQALKAIAECIGDAARRPTDLSARYGGEEFAVLLPGESTEGAIKIADRIQANVLSLRASQQKRPIVTPTVSVGVASMVPNAGLNPGDLIRTADAALYGAKRLGRNRIEVAPTIRLVGAEREAIAR